MAGVLNEVVSGGCTGLRPDSLGIQSVLALGSKWCSSPCAESLRSREGQAGLRWLEGEAGPVSLKSTIPPGFLE